METRVRYGIKLVSRKCEACGSRNFWVPRSSPQKFCSYLCETEGSKKKRKKAGLWPYRRKSRKLKIDYELTEDDYE